MFMHAFNNIYVFLNHALLWLIAGWKLHNAVFFLPKGLITSEKDQSMCNINKGSKVTPDSISTV